MLLLFLLFIPITGVLAILLIFREQVTGVVEVPSLVDVSNVVEVSNVMDIQSDNIKSIGLIASTLNFSVALIIFIMSDFSTNQFQFVQEYHEISYFDFYLGIDGLSIYFVLLTTLIIPISLLSN
jgi:NADH:ubiquinone oxidoreductase subunit 4 (subunit M)